VDDSDIKRTDDGQTAADVLKPAAPRAEIRVGNDKAAAASAPVTLKPTDKSQPKASAPAPAAVAAAVKATPAPAAAATSVPAENPPATADAAPGSGYAVQVAALNVRSEADAVAKRLTAKGYAAYVQVPTSGAAAVYRVRVGTFKTRREAETVASRLQKEESFKPWVTR
jgi:cell division septation protein DedD